MPGSRLGWLALATLLSAVAVLANPVGPGLLSYVVGIWSNPAIRSLIAEWRPLGSEAGTSAIFLVSLLAVPLLAAWRRRLPDPTDLLLLLGMAWLAVGAVRNLLWYGLVLAPALARVLAGRQDPPEGRPQWALHLTALLSVTLLVVLALPWVKGVLPLPAALRGLYAQDTPVATAEYVARAGPEGPLFHRMESGSYLLWRLSPRFQVFIDPRIELYPDQVWQEYLDLSAGRPGFQEVLDRYGIRLLLLNRTQQSGLVQQVQSSPQWEQVYENAAEDTLVFRRRE